MKISIALTAVAAALAAVTVAGYTPAAPTPTSPAAFSTLPAPGSAVAEYQKEQSRAVRREMKANAAVGLPSGADRGLAEAAASDQVPFVFSLGGNPGVNGTADVWLRLPDRSLWQLHTGGALTHDTWLEHLFAAYGGGLPAMSYRTVPAPAFDAAAADAANRSGAPYRWREDCHTFVRIPGSDVTFTVPTTLTTHGEALHDGVGGCDGLPFPGQTTPKGN